MRAIFFLVFSVLWIANADARPLTDAEQSSLDATRDRFLSAFETDDYAAIIAVVPPRVMDHIAGTAKVSVDELRAKMTEIFEAGFDGIEFNALTMDTSGFEATEVRDGNETFVWGFAPTYMEMSVNGQVMKNNTQTVALLDRGKWYLIRTDEMQQVMILRQVYPFFEGVTFPGAQHSATQ